MKPMLALTLALAAGLAASAQAQSSGTTPTGGRSVLTVVSRAGGAGSITLAQNAPAPEKAVEAQALPRIPEGTPVVVMGVINKD